MSSSALHIDAVPYKPRLGFVGLGWIGRNRLASVVEAGVAEIAALHDPQASAAEEGHKVSPDTVLFSSFEELLHHDLDGVVIATPNRFHAEQAIAAFEHGIAVFCQKPLGRNAFETRRIVEAARNADSLLGVDLCYGAIPAMQAVSKLVESGALGKIFAVDARFHNGYGPDKAWFYDYVLSGGGCVLDLGPHLLDLALRPLGFPRVAQVQSSLFNSGKLMNKGSQEIEDYAVATIETADDTVISLSCCWKLHMGSDAEIEIAFYGTEGGAALRNVNGSFYDFVAQRFDRTRTETLSSPEDSKWQWGGLVTVEWIKQLASDGSFNPKAERFVEIAELIDRIYTSCD
ncbi:MAG TPA: Gfo/Idh/MocA family oxidoreductase [Pyrinomonadaceae bacterium]|nr:Gfo/Idh/MocA family oxidoreductase [Pyrinomonadaceae bacterium]